MAKITMQTDLIKMLGKKLYESPALGIACRELLQNSIDACQDEPSPKIEITITQEPNADSAVITCDDNGIGMTAEIIEFKFLCLGGTTKTTGNTTGGFGIAKAALLSNESFELYTLNNHFNSGMLESDADIDTHAPPRKGTRVKIEIKEDSYWTIKRGIDLAIHYILTSSIPDNYNVTLTVNRGNDTEVYKPLDPAAFHRLQLENLQQCRIEHIKPLIPPKNYPNGAIVYRDSRGLTQYLDSGYNFKGIIQVDINTNGIPPTSDDYPLSTSREKAASTIRLPAEQHARKLNENPLSANSDLERAGHEEKQRVRPGILLNGDQDPQTPEQIAEIIKNAEKAQIIQIDCKLRPNSKRLIKAFGAILQITAPNLEFTLAIDADPNLSAAKRGNCYHLNPENAIEEIPYYDRENLDSVIFFLWHLACHESAHYYQHGHNENFTSQLGKNHAESAAAIARLMPALKRTTLRRFNPNDPMF